MSDIYFDSDGEVVNYRELLMRYMAHVVDCEGITFLSDRILHPGSDLSKTEREELIKIATELSQKMGWA